MAAPSVAVLSACYAGYDLVRAQEPQDVDVDFILFTDDPGLEAPGWKVVVDEAHGAHPNLAAKRVKLLPPIPHRWVVWIDANTQITYPSFVREASKYVNDGIALYRHPRRECIYEEAEASLGAESQNGRYEGIGIEDQVAHYRAEGHPEHAGLYACGTIVWDQENPEARQLGFAWMTECSKWTHQDQISFPVVCRRLGIEPGVFPHRQLERRFRGPDYCGNRWQRLYDHLPQS